ncbi:RNA polymerase II large subunit CTD [Penicillium cf. griseofulvum]|uniref:RNA polymerase II large subunit CTD n=1 Tax=Penicillium cf. griseofulvum TaxID=2972120 RepID=A0A9W9J4N2_9EURO|nr:RNA polymerase II large subunit CTD [Penicillium cf. griseofulvum]KAJ5427819.1 RNA polymerase II large subunit CTD [Penicillium cf. griseofulvum]KAJ5432021.1 RNA polymerase II large subunit CTD [Penicillium cf. griseofulvum]
MAFTDDAVKAKLSALNDSQESIVTVAQWVMFHRRHAERTGQIWLQKIRDSPPPKRLNLIYLANEVAQQSKVRGKHDFLIALSPIIVDATSAAYKGSSSEYQQRIRRVVEVWRQRNVFDGAILDAVEARIDELDKARPTNKKQTLGGAFFKDISSGSTPSELQPLNPLQVALTKAVINSNNSATTATSEFDKLHDPKTPKPTLPVHAARLSSLLKTLANAENSVSEVIKARRDLIDGLEKILQTNRAELSKEEALSAELSQKKSSVDTKKREVEDAIMRGLPSGESSINPGEHNGHDAASARPEVEALTPPPVEAITPVGSPQPEKQQLRRGPFTEEADDDSSEWNPTTIPNIQELGEGAVATDKSTTVSPNHDNNFDITADGHAKRRKISHGEEDYAAFAGGELDADVADLLASQGKQ